jgi:hypothetical protein
MANIKPSGKVPVVGDVVTWYFWDGGDAGSMRSYPAKVTAVYPPPTPDAGARLDLDVELDEEVLASGIVTTQTDSPERLQIETDIHASGQWTQNPSAFPAKSPKAPASASA